IWPRAPSSMPMRCWEELPSVSGTSHRVSYITPDHADPAYVSRGERSVRTLCCVLAVAAFAVSCGGRSPSTANGTLTIAVIPKGTSHVFWQSIHAGAEKAAREAGAAVIWRGPLREDDRASQVSEVEGFVTRGVSGIVLAPLDEAALVTPVADAETPRV